MNRKKKLIIPTSGPDNSIPSAAVTVFSHKQMGTSWYLVRANEYRLKYRNLEQA